MRRRRRKTTNLLALEEYEKRQNLIELSRQQAAQGRELNDIQANINEGRALSIDDLDNEHDAPKWLDLSPDETRQGVIFMNDVDEIMVVVRQSGIVEPFITSPFANNIEAYLVFLDEALTRGIDLVLPDHYQAATTLDPKITKDRLVHCI